jgi:hypothetical protein
MQRPDDLFDPFALTAEYDGGTSSDDVDLGHPDYNDPATLAKLSELAGRPAPPTMSPGLLGTKARDLSQSILASFDMLRETLVRHEATIHRRWVKKKKQQKIEILEHAWPGMAKTHRPDFALWRQNSTTLRQTEMQAESGQKPRFMCPYINQEDLLKPRTLLLMLNARGRHPPADFAGSDCETMHFGRVTQSLMPVFLNTYTMILNGAHDHEEYGKLVSWDEDEDAFFWYIGGMQFMPGEGLLVLEAQKMVMDFLVALCNNILHDIPADIRLTDVYPAQPEPLLKTDNEAGGFDSMAVMALEAPYRVPARLDFARIEALLGAKVASADDHIWQLREDPGYFIEQLHEIREHRQEMIKDTNGQAHPVCSSRFQSEFWSRVLGDLVANAYIELEIFAELHKQAIQLRYLHSKYEPVISPTKDLPEKYLMALLKFRHYLYQAAKGSQGILKQGVVASPPIRKFFVRTPPVDKTSTKIHIRGRPGVKIDKGEGEAIWLLQTLWEDGDNLFLMRMPFVVDELERLLEAEPTARNLVSAHIAAQIGNLSIISQCLRQLEMYQPWARGFENALPDKADALKDEFAKSSAPQARLLQTLHEKSKLGQAAKLCEYNGNFTYPSTKRRTKETTEAMIMAERNLDQLWVSIDRLVHTDAGDLECMAVKRALLRPQLMQRTLEWVEPAPTPKGQPTAVVMNPGVESLYRPLSTLYFDHSSDGVAGTPTDISKKAKIKTKGQQSMEPSAATAIDAIPSLVAAKTQIEPIQVDARALKVFRTLFYDPAVTSTPGEVSWADFTYALTSTGKFTAEKLYGSVWQFARIDGPGQSRIQFHEPHPRGKVPFVVARRHGRRLSRAYGWTRETFILK